MNETSRLIENLESVRARMAEAARRSGRSPEAVKLVAVTKYVDADIARQLVAAGCRQLGEARPQSLWQKAAALAGEPVDWHLIGHLQRNKLVRTLPLVRLIHSGDSLRLIEAIDAEAAVQVLAPMPLLVEVNVSGDATKHGFHPDELLPLGARLGQCRHVAVRGLMCMAGREGDVESARRNFEQLRLLRDRLRTVWPTEVGLDELSMGMTGDFEVAIEEGATIVRVGSALFEGIGAP